jgi:signal peptidase I
MSETIGSDLGAADPKAVLSRRRKRILSWVIACGVVLVGVFVLLLLTFKPFKIPTGAMVPAISPGDFVMANKRAYLFSKPKRGDIVVFSTKGIPEIMARNQARPAIYTFRIVGLPLDTVDLSGDKILVNGKEPEELAGRRYVTLPDLQSTTEVLVPQDAYFVIGDNSANSWDSRSWGTVPGKDILGERCCQLRKKSAAGVTVAELDLFSNRPVP